MFILMHCGGMPFNGRSLQTSSLGGSESAAYYLAKELAERGHRVILFTNSEEEGVFDGVKYCFAGPQADDAPLGVRFHFFAENTPHDICIAQRDPRAFLRKVASKMNFFWMHDLAQGKYIPMMNSQLWNINRLMCVSEWHRQQIHGVYGIPLPGISVLPNGVDSEAYANSLDMFHRLKISKKVELVYSSRPERGLEHLVRPGGIMERLEELAPGRFHLNYCNYNNKTPHMASLYDALDHMAERLGSVVTNVGHLTKADLADLQLAADVWCYPTEFDEVSCISAMEAVTAGLQIVCSDSAAIKETLQHTGNHQSLIPLKDGVADEDAFVMRLMDLQKRADHLPRLKSYTWTRAADVVEQVAKEEFSKGQSSTGAVARHFMRMSDIYALRQYLTENESSLDPIALATKAEMEETYRFAFERKWKEHYQAYYQYEKDRGVNYGPEYLDGNTRFEGVSMLVEKALEKLPPGQTALIMDYGCAHGHYTVNLAKRFPDHAFIGVDIEMSNVAKAMAWAKDEGLENVNFYCGTVEDIETLVPEGPVDIIIAAEVLEHLEDPAYTTDKLATYLLSHGTMILTTPFGPWEYLGAIEHYPWRAHVHHFERADLHDLWGAHPEFNVQVATGSHNAEGEVLGSYITTFGKPVKKSGSIDYARKFRETMPRQTASLCMIVKDGEESILKAVKSMIGHVEEVIIAVDEKTTDFTSMVISRMRELMNGCPVPRILTFSIPSPLETGFDEARNQSIQPASGDWIVWLDADEHAEGGANLSKYLRPNIYNGYAVDHIHLSVDPPGALRIDKPSRVFRNHEGIQFYGMVHEHPELEVNKGVGHAVLIPDFKISHVGYTTESVRIKRFYRNIGLMAKDREKYPDRQIGKFLWVRDLSMMCRFELQSNGGRMTQDIIAKAEEGTAVFEDLVATSDERMLVDGLEYYSVLSAILGGVEMDYQLNMSRTQGEMKGEPPRYRGVFRNVEQARKFVDRVFNERIKGYDSKYW